MIGNSSDVHRGTMVGGPRADEGQSPRSGGESNAPDVTVRRFCFISRWKVPRGTPISWSPAGGGDSVGLKPTVRRSFASRELDGAKR